MWYRCPEHIRQSDKGVINPARHRLQDQRGSEGPDELMARQRTVGGRAGEKEKRRTAVEPETRRIAKRNGRLVAGARLMTQRSRHGRVTYDKRAPIKNLYNVTGVAVGWEACCRPQTLGPPGTYMDNPLAHSARSAPDQHDPETDYYKFSKTNNGIKNIHSKSMRKQTPENRIKRLHKKNSGVNGLILYFLSYDVL